MTKKAHLLEEIALTNLEIAPSQVWGAVRIVPLLRRQVRGDLRLLKRKYDEDFAIVNLDDERLDRGLKYISYIPHGLVLSWSDDGSPVAAMGGQLITEGKRYNNGIYSTRVMHRMAKREAKNQLRFLPLHLAMEGFLSIHFSGPEIAWEGYSRRAKSQGLSPRIEFSVSGRAIPALEDALRVFEIHENQVGVLLFISESLASTFVVPTPEDYRALHSSLLQDFYGELMYEYGLYGMATRIEAEIDDSQINDLETLGKAIAIARSHWAEFQGFMASNLLGREIESKRIYTAGGFTLQRFVTDLQLKSENHMGEAIVRENGQLEYLKTYRLSEAQTRRAYLLKQLALHQWHLEETARSLGNTLDEFIQRLDRAGFGYLINDGERQKAKKQN
ncbi:MAG: ARPP-2 domain-containing protein [Microcoleus sp.]